MVNLNCTVWTSSTRTDRSEVVQEIHANDLDCYANGMDELTVIASVGCVRRARHSHPLLSQKPSYIHGWTATSPIKRRTESSELRLGYFNAPTSIKKQFATRSRSEKRDNRENKMQRKNSAIQATATIPDLIQAISELAIQPYRRQCARCLRTILSSDTRNMCKVVLCVLGMNQRENEINTTFGGDSLLHIAAQRGLVDIVRLLLKHGADAGATNSKGDTALHAACAASLPESESFVEIAKLLLDSACIPNNAKNTPLHLAADFRITKLLLDKGASVADKNIARETPLLMAVKRGNIRAVKVLLPHCHDVLEWCDVERRTPIHVAAENGSTNIIVQLINEMRPIHRDKTDTQTGASLDCLNTDNETPVHVAARLGHHQVLVLLLNEQANVDVLNDNGQSPLILASIHGHKEAVAVLLKFNAELFTEVDGMTAFDYAAQLEHHVIASLLYKEMMTKRRLSHRRSNGGNRSASGSPKGSTASPSRLLVPRHYLDSPQNKASPVSSGTIGRSVSHASAQSGISPCIRRPVVNHSDAKHSASIFSRLF